MMPSSTALVADTIFVKVLNHAARRSANDLASNSVADPLRILVYSSDARTREQVRLADVSIPNCPS